MRAVNLGNAPALGKKTIVVGAGNVAMDACRSAVRLGADTTVVYRRTENEMTASREEYEDALAEGIKFRFLAGPVEIVGKDGKAAGLKVEIMELGEADERGRRKPVGTGKFEIIEADSVISAIGQAMCHYCF